MIMNTDIHSVFVLLLGLFTLGATFLAAYTVANAIRLRNVRLSWKAGKLIGYPLFSTLFLTSSLIMGGVVYYLQLDHYFAIFGCYSWMGISWFISSYFSSKVYITDHGVVKNINDTSQTIAWHQIVDYVDKPSEKGSDYIFIYFDRSEERRLNKKTIRIELFVPDSKLVKFDKIISLKIGKTMAPVADTSFDIKAFE